MTSSTLTPALHWHSQTPGFHWRSFHDQAIVKYHTDLSWLCHISANHFSSRESVSLWWFIPQNSFCIYMPESCLCPQRSVRTMAECTSSTTTRGLHSGMIHGPKGETHKMYPALLSHPVLYVGRVVQCESPSFQQEPLSVAGWSRSTPCPQAGRWSTPRREFAILWTTTHAPPLLKTPGLGLSQGNYFLPFLSNLKSTG